MGTRKKMVLASLVSLMMAMAFVIGLMPAHDGARLSAGSGGSVDMADLLDMVLGTKGVGEIVVTSPVSGVVVKTPEDNFDPSALEIAVPVTAGFEPTGSEEFRFGASNLNDPNAFLPEAGAWVGNVISDAVGFPFSTGINVAPFLTGLANVQTSLGIYALLNPEQVNASTWLYEDVNAEPLPITIFETESSVDSDGNGFPDSPFDVLSGIQPGEIWIANVEIDGELRTVLVANLDPGSGKGGLPLGEVFVSPNGDVQLSSPTLADLQTAGLIPGGESGLLVVEVAGDLSVIVDEVDGVASAAARQAWAADALDAAPGIPTASAQFVEISILYTVGGQFDELGSLAGSGLSLDLTLNNIGNQVGEAVELYSYPTFVGDQGGSIFVTNLPGEQAWRHIEGAVVADTSVTASLETLSVFSPLVTNASTPIELVGASPSTIPANEDSDVALEGVFGTAVALNLAEAAAAYRVYLGGLDGDVLPFTVGPADGPAKGNADVAVTAYNGTDNNFMYVTIPASAAVDGDDLNITVADLDDANNFATAAGLITVEATEVCTVDVVIEGAGSGTVTLNPENGDGLNPGEFECGSVISATAAPAAGSVFAGWQIDGADAGTDNPLALTVAGSDGDTLILTATFEEAPTPEYTLTIGAATGGNAVATTDPNGVDDMTAYLEGTTVSVVATPATGFEFVSWGGPDGGDVTGGANGSIVMNSDKEIVPVFQEESVVSFELTIIEENNNGVVNRLTPPNGPNGTYLANTEVCLEAVPNSGFEFAGWLGPVDDPAAANTCLTITSDVTITAQFSEIGLSGVNINSVTPNEAWIFGGVVTMISGSGFSAASTVTIDGVDAEITGVNGAGTVITAIVPETADVTDAATVVVDVTVTTGVESDTLADGFTYIRHLSEGGVNSTAFILSDPNNENELDVTLGEPHTTAFAQVILPSLETPTDVTTVFGVARNALVTADTKQNTPALAALGTSGIGAGESLTGSRDFTLHLYANASVESAKNTPPAGAATFGNANGLIGFNRPIDSDGDPQASTPLLLSYPLDDSDLSYDDVRNSLTYWGTLVEYDYVSRVATPVDPDSSEYQSEIENDEVLPVNGEQDGGEQPDAINLARLYTLNGFSLRQNAILSAELAEGIRLNTDTGTAQGPVEGGTGLTIVSPGGGIANLDRIVFADAAKQISATVTPEDFDTTPGSNEYEVTFDTPAVNDDGIASIILFGKADPNTPIVTLERAFEYRADSQNVSSLALILLGLLVAILGLAAGGESGSSGGGGPCFIATAAYGTPMAAEIDVLRDVRDTYFLGNAFGTAVTDAYYRVSPAVADVVASSPAAATAVRVALLPVILLGKIALSMPALASFIMLSLGFLYIKRSRKALRA